MAADRSSADAGSPSETQASAPAGSRWTGMLAALLAAAGVAVGLPVLEALRGLGSGGEWVLLALVLAACAVAFVRMAAAALAGYAEILLHLISIRELLRRLRKK